MGVLTTEDVLGGGEPFKLMIIWLSYCVEILNSDSSFKNNVELVVFFEENSFALLVILIKNYNLVALDQVLGRLVSDLGENRMVKLKPIHVDLDSLRLTFLDLEQWLLLGLVSVL